jgi:hypothetical protein
MTVLIFILTGYLKRYAAVSGEFQMMTISTLSMSTQLTYDYKERCETALQFS